MSANPIENSVELREGLKNGTLSLRDLDNKQKRRSSKGRRRRSKTKTGRTEEADDRGETKVRAVEDPKHSKKEPKGDKSSRTKNVPKGKEIQLEISNQHKESEEIVRSLLDEAFDTVTRHCIAIEHGVAYEQAHTLANAFMAAFDERVELTGKIYMDMKRETKELLYKAAEENVKDLIIRATTQEKAEKKKIAYTHLDTIIGMSKFLERFNYQEKEQHNVVSTVDLQHSAELDKRMRAHIEQMKAEKLAMQQIMEKAASEVVKDLFSCAANNASKSKTWSTESTGENHTTKADVVKDPGKAINASKITKSPETKTVPKERVVDFEVSPQHKESEEIVRSILEEVLDTVTGHGVAYQQSVTNDQALMLVLGCVAAFDEINQFTKKFYVDERGATQEKLYREAKENVKNLLRSTEFRARMRAQVKQINAEKQARKEIVYKAASETVEDLFSCAANNASVQNVLETEMTNGEETDCELPVRGCRRFLCCGQTTKPKQKKKKTGFFARLRRLFGRR